MRRGTANSLLRRLREMTPAGLENARLRMHAPSIALLRDMYPAQDDASSLVCYVQSRGNVRVLCNELGC